MGVDRGKDSTDMIHEAVWLARADARIERWAATWETPEPCPPRSCSPRHDALAPVGGRTGR